ncbi:MAG: hypothetical protein ABDH49_07640 [Candidatus Hydrothermales bacterium]
MFPIFALDPKKTFEEAKKLRDEGKWERAYSLCKRALKTSPKDPDLLEISAELSTLLKNYQEAFGHFVMLKNFPDRKKRILELFIQYFGGDEKDKILLREQVILELISEGSFEKLENLFPLIPEREKKHFFEKHLGKEELSSQLFVYFILFFSKNYIEASLKFVDIYRKYKEQSNFLRKEIIRLQNVGFTRKYASFINFLISYSQGNETEALEYIEDLLEDGSFSRYIYSEFEKRPPENPQLKLLFSELLISKGERKKGLLVLKSILSQKEAIDLNYASEIIKEVKKEDLDEEEAAIYSEILRELGKTEEAAEFLKRGIKTIDGIKTLRESLLRSFSPRAFRILLEIDEEKIDENLNFLYKNSPDYLNDREVLNVLKDFCEEKRIRSSFFLFSLASSLIRNGEYKSGITIFRYLLRKEFESQLILREFLRKKEDLRNLREGLILLAEIYMMEKNEKIFSIVKELIEKFRDSADYALLILDELGERYIEWNDRIIDFLNREKEKFSKKYLVVEGLSFIRSSRLKDGVFKLYEAYKEGNKFVYGIVEKFYKEEIPEFNFLRGILLLELEKFDESYKYLKNIIKEKSFLKEIAKTLTEKIKKKKNSYLIFLYLNLLLTWNKLEEAEKFLSLLKSEAKDEKMLGDIISFESIVLYHKGEINKAKELIKTLLREKRKFDPIFLYEFLKEKEEQDKSPFIYQTLGSLAILLNKPLEATRYYFLLAINSPQLISKIKDIYLTVETKFPYFPEIDLYKLALRVLEGKENKISLLKFLEENPELKEEFKFFLKIFPETQTDPYLLFLLAKLKYEDGLTFEEEIIKSYEIALKERLYELIESLREYSYEKIKRDEAEKELLFYILKRDRKEFTKFFRLLKDKGFIQKYELESLEIMRDAFVKGEREKEFLLTYADFLADRNDKSSIYLYNEILDRYPEEIEKRKSKWEKFIPEGINISLNLAIKFKDTNRLKEEIKKILTFNLLGTFYGIIKEIVKIFDYEKELFETLRICAEKVKDIETEIYLLKELSYKEKKIEYFKALIERLLELKSKEISSIWKDFIYCIVENKKFDILNELWEKHFKKEYTQVNYMENIFLRDPRRFFKEKVKRNFPLPIKEP